MKTLFTILFVAFSIIGFGQTHKSLNSYKSTEEYDNVHVLKISEDDHQSSYIIWVKDSVPEHYHADHTENIVVLSGKAIMTLDDKTITVKKGDYINIPEGTKHSVKEVKSHGPLKVLSNQAPLFSGRDRIFTKPKKEK